MAALAAETDLKMSFVEDSVVRCCKFCEVLEVPSVETVTSESAEYDRCRVPKGLRLGAAFLAVPKRFHAGIVLKRVDRKKKNTNRKEKNGEENKRKGDKRSKERERKC